MKKPIGKFFAWIVIFAFVNFMFMNTFFIHSHKDFSGRQITHSHPFSPLSKHTHNANEIVLIANFNFVASTAVTSSIVLAPEVTDTKWEVISEKPSQIVARYTSTKMLRAPPFFS